MGLLGFFVPGATRPRVGVIGAGAGGLVAARVLREVADVVVLEREAAVGGIWRPESSVLYKGLVTNLPKQIMAFRDTPFREELPTFVTAAMVGEYLHGYAEQHALWPNIRLSTRVDAVNFLRDGARRWSVQCSNVVGPNGSDLGASEVEEFDVLIIANGHYEKPAYAELAGEKDFPGQVIHSAAYDVPYEFADKVVLCIGARSSGTDLARELSTIAARTLTADKACVTRQVFEENENLIRVPPVRELRPDGSVVFEDGSTESNVDVVIHCVGYDYFFPFLRDGIDEGGLPLEVGGRRVAPLWEHMMHVEEPSLFFLGIPHSVVPFPLMEVQATLIARLLSGVAELPDLQTRREWAHNYETNLHRLKDAHHLGDKQWNYLRRLLAVAGVDDPAWETAISTNEAVYNHVGPQRPKFPGGPDTYRRRTYIVNHASGEWSCT